MTTTLVKRPARTQPPVVESGELTIAEPPSRSQSPPAMQGAGMMLMPIMSGTGSLTMAVTQDRPILVVSGFLILIGSIAIGAIMILSQRSGTKRAMREGRERYLDYIEELRHTVRDQIASQRAEQAWRFPSPDQLIDIGRDDSRRWERRPNHSDFLTVRLGTGEVPLASGLTMSADTGPLNDFDPVALQAAQELQSRYATLRDQPITTDLRTVSHLSVLGSRATTRALARNLVLQIVSLHGPSDVQVAVARSDAEADAWDWVKWLPHNQDEQTYDGDVPARRITSSSGAMQENLEADLGTRLDLFQRARGGRSAVGQHLVLVVDDEHAAGAQHLASPDPDVPLAALGVHVITLVEHQRQEPEAVDDRVTIASDGSMALASRPNRFTLDTMVPGLETAIARRLSPLRLVAGGYDEEQLNDTVGLPEILGVKDAARLDLDTSWRPRTLRDLLRVPIGVGSTGRPVMLDLKESAHGGMGPHGLIVGATGAGKSEMLRTLVSSLVLGHPPDRLALMLVDFKGGATFAAMEDIPHIAGMITNLEDDLTLVDRMRDALYGEMQRRQEILKAAGNLPNVTAYHNRIDAGEDLEPLPHLLVIIDEFSELLTAKPDFAELYVAIGRIGRSIGVHLLLATQKLEMGKIRGLESHLSYRISLRTFSESESRDAIGVPDAYNLPPEPGSGYLKVDTSVFERFKAALVSAQYEPPVEEVKTTVPVVPYVAVNGVGAWVAHQNSMMQTVESALATPATGADDQTVLEVLCRQLEESGAPPVRKVWLEPLPERMTLGDLIAGDTVSAPATCKAVLGMVDDPEHQDQYPLEWDFTGGGANLVVCGSPQTGKSTLLRTLIVSVAMTYAPGDMAFYCIDYGGGVLQGVKTLPHVASVASRVDPERIQRTINDVRTVLDERETTFREYGLESMAALRKARADGSVPKSVPGDVFLVVDGWGPFRDEYDDLDYAIADVAARGTNFGVHVIVSVTQSMQIRMRMQASMGGQLELRMNDAYDSAFDRKTMEQIPKDAVGRGITGTRNDAKLFQAALPQTNVEDGVDDSVKQAELVEAIVNKWPDSAVRKVEILPRVLDLSELPALTGPGAARIGVSEVDLGPADIDLFGADPHLQIYGDGQIGKSNLLKVLIRGLMNDRAPEDIAIAVVDYRRSLLDFVPEDYLLSYVTGEEQAIGVCNDIAGAIKDRAPGPDVTSEQLRTRSWWTGPEVFVVVDDYDLVSTSSGNPLNVFVDLLAQGRDLGFHFVLARRTGGMSRAVFEPLIQRMIDLSAPGFMFSGDRMEGRLIGGHPSQRLPVGRAMYVTRDGVSSLVQTAKLDE